MDLQDLDRLVAKYAAAGYEQIRVKAGDLEIEVKQPVASSATPAPKLPVVDADVTVVKSPMVGVLHLASDVKVGQTVTHGHELGQIESMKLFNALPAPSDGTITAILVADQAPVEFDQPLFEMRKDR